MGKNWARGLTSATHEGIARNGRQRRGMRYRTGRRQLRGEIQWTPEMAYALGLVATDGCLSPDRRHIFFDSADHLLVVTFVRCIAREDVKIVRRETRSGGWCFRAAFSDVGLYDWFLARGILPAKSLTLGAIEVPDSLYTHLVRGLLDGDGTIYNAVLYPTKKTYPEYTYERLWTLFGSASRPHLDWLRAKLLEWTGLRGYLTQEPLREGRKPFYRLKYGNRDSITLLGKLYANPNAPCLERKHRIWFDYVQRHGMTG